MSRAAENHAGRESQPHRRTGTVYLVGAGPGDPGLLTVRAGELIAAADVILYDRLIPATALDLARDDAELTYVGKRPRNEGDSDGPVRQERISQLMIETALEGRDVVRLKGGDPFVFGRGGEEAEALREAGIPFEIVPGITAGVAAPAYAGVPVTHRDDAGAVAFVSGHEVPDWDAYARFPGTLAFYMGMQRLEENARALIAAGRSPDEPAVVIERGTFPDQRVVHGSLETIGAIARDESISAPAIVIVGAVAERGRRLEWFRSGPLAGQSIVVTRARAQASALVERLRALGAEPIELPMIRVEPLLDTDEVREAISSIHTYALVVVTSANGADLLFEAMAEQDRDARALAQATVAAVGPSTAQALEQRHGIRADIVPERAVAEALVEALEPVDLFERPVLIAGAAAGRPVIADSLRRRGAYVDAVALYETVAEEVDRETLEEVGRADLVTLASGSAARNLARALGEGGPANLPGRIVSIGPITSETARSLGFDVTIEADPHTLEGLISALIEVAGS